MKKAPSHSQQTHPSEEDKFDPIQRLGIKGDHYQQSGNSSLQNLETTAWPEAPLLYPLCPTHSSHRALPMNVLEAETRCPATNEQLDLIHKTSSRTNLAGLFWGSLWCFILMLGRGRGW